MGLRRGDARLTVDEELRVLWLTQGSQELALSDDGVWLRSGRRAVDLEWQEIEQLQAVAIRGIRSGNRRRIEIFVRDGHVHVVGPFPSTDAERWVKACARSAADGGRRALPLEGAEGFAFRP